MRHSSASICLGARLRIASGPAVLRPRNVGRTHDRTRPRRTYQIALASTGSSTHDAWYSLRRSAEGGERKFGGSYNRPKSLDDLVGAGEDRRRDRQAERCGRFEILILAREQLMMAVGLVGLVGGRLPKMRPHTSPACGMTRPTGADVRRSWRGASTNTKNRKCD